MSNVVERDDDAGFDVFVEQWFEDASVWAAHDRLVARRKADVAADADSFTGRFEYCRGVDVACAVNRPEAGAYHRRVHPG